MRRAVEVDAVDVRGDERDQPLRAPVVVADAQDRMRAVSLHVRDPPEH